MLKRFFKFIFTLRQTEEEKELLKKIIKKQERLARHGGRMVVSRKGGLSHKFDTKEGEAAYNKEVKEKFFRDNPKLSKFCDELEKKK